MLLTLVDESAEMMTEDSLQATCLTSLCSKSNVCAATETRNDRQR